MHFCIFCIFFFSRFFCLSLIKSVPLFPMKRRRYIAWMLMLVSMVMLVASVLPHHHHRELLCLQHDVTEECVCTCTAECTCPECAKHHHATADGGHRNCGAGCVTKFNSLTPDKGHDVLSPEYAFCSLLYTLSDAWMFALQLSEDKTSHHTCYLEKLHSTCLPHVKGLRAPPCVLA